jgi:AcrR family transcriptional regulator
MTTDAAEPEGAEGDVPARERILRAALRLFAERGFAGTSAQAVADAAGVTSGLIFYHFDTKEGLLRTLMEERSLLPRAREVLRGRQDAGPRQRLRALGREFFRVAGQERDLTRVLLQEVHLHDAVSEHFDAVAGELIDLVAAEFERAGPAGTDPSTAARVFVYAVVFAGVFRPPDDPERFVEEALRGLLAGGGGDGPGRSVSAETSGVPPG